LYTAPDARFSTIFWGGCYTERFYALGYLRRVSIELRPAHKTCARRHAHGICRRFPAKRHRPCFPVNSQGNPRCCIRNDYRSLLYGPKSESIGCDAHIPRATAPWWHSPLPVPSDELALKVSKNAVVSRARVHACELAELLTAHSTGGSGKASIRRGLNGRLAVRNPEA